MAAGSALGIAIHVLLLWLLTPWGLPRLAMLWPLAVTALCLARPQLRWAWRSPAQRTTPAVLSWTLAPITVLAFWIVASSQFAGHELRTLPGMHGQFVPVAPQVDMAFHQSIAAAVLHGNVDGFPFIAMNPSPLRYQLMAYEHFADVARWTGTDLTLVLYRLYIPAFLTLAIILIATIGYRLVGRAHGGVFAAAFGYFTNTPAIYSDNFGPFGSFPALSAGHVFASPTQTFGQPLFR